MSVAFTNVGEYRRGKGNRKTRLGPRMRPLQSEASEMKRVKTPNKIALAKLAKFLDKRVPSDRRNALIRPLDGAEQLRFMSMSVLAEVLYYMNTFNMDIELINQNFSYNSIMPYIDVLIHRHITAKKGRAPGSDDINIMKLRLAATFARYIKYVAIMRESATQVQAEMQSQSQIAGTVTAASSYQF